MSMIQRLFIYVSALSIGACVANMGCAAQAQTVPFSPFTNACTAGGGGGGDTTDALLLAGKDGGQIASGGLATGGLKLQANATDGGDGGTILFDSIADGGSGYIWSPYMEIGNAASSALVSFSSGGTTTIRGNTAVSFLGGDVTFNSKLLAGSTYDLGTSGSRWGTAYVTTLNSGAITSTGSSLLGSGKFKFNSTGVFSIPDDAGSRGDGSTSANSIRFYGGFADYYLYGAGGDFYLSGGSSTVTKFNGGSIDIPSDKVYGFSSTTTASGSVDTAVSRCAAGILCAGTGASGSTAGSVAATKFQFGTSDFAAAIIGNNGVVVTTYRSSDGSTDFGSGYISARSGYFGASAPGSSGAYWLDSAGFRMWGGALNVSHCASGVGVCIGDGTVSRSNAPLLHSVLVSAKTSGVGAPYSVSATADNNTFFTNEGAAAKVYLALPTASANRTYTVIVQDSDGVRVVANTGDTIRVAASVSATAGYCESTTVGDSATWVAINATEWIATSVVGSGWSCT